MRRERIGLKEKEPSCDAKEAPQQPKREGTSSASILETLQVIKPASRRMHFSFHSSLRRHGKFIGNGELLSLAPGIPEQSAQESGLEALQRGSSLWIRISSCLPHSRDPCKRPTAHRPPPQQTKGQTFRGVVPSCFLNMQTCNKKEIGGKEIIRSTTVISI